MKKSLVILVATALFCSLTACGSEIDPSANGMDTSAAESQQPSASAIDYTAFCGNYSDTDTVEGPCYTVSILHADNETKAIEISISYVGIKSSPLYVTEPIHASIASDHTVQFEWTDSWQNQGIGTLVLNPDEPSMVQLMMTVTEEAEVNRATLSTHDQHKTVLRR